MTLRILVVILDDIEDVSFPTIMICVDDIRRSASTITDTWIDGEGRPKITLTFVAID